CPGASAMIDRACPLFYFERETGRGEARRPDMSTLRYDLAQRPAPMGRAYRHRAVQEWEMHPAGIGSRMGWGVEEGTRSFLSVVGPAKNEAASLPQLIEEIAGALGRLGGDGDGDGEGHGLRRPAGFEILVVDDASTDRTCSVLEDLAAGYPELRWLGLSATVGQSAATVAGIRAARGDWIATLDADLQNDPADLVRLWEA